MAMIDKPYGKDRVAKGSESYITDSLAGKLGSSNGVHTYDTGRDGQVICTPIAMDNVKLAFNEETSILDMSWRGGPTNLKHSLKGASVEDDIGAAGSVKRTIISDH
jgi:hypothetical protein